MRCCARVKSSDDREFKKKRSTLNVQRSTPKSEKLSRLSPRRASMDLRSALDTSAATTILFVLAPRRGSQVVRSRSAKPLFAGSIPAPASQSRAALVDNVVSFSPSGSIDSLAPARSPATLASLTVYLGGPVPPPSPHHARFIARRSLGSEVRKPLSRRRSASVSRLITALISAL